MRDFFREDINGLRAIAVLAVVLFHLDLEAISGGFLGVDVFFVISGYLITGSILRELKEGRFSFLSFYYRRCRRLMPALVATVLLSLAAGYFLFPPRQFAQLGGSAAAALAWLSNIYFWLQSGYFDTDAITKPLLHTWSLGVEEQFYLIWPLALLLGFRVAGARGTAITIAVLLVGGLALSEWAVHAAPDAGFYLTPFRVYEFAIGAAVVFTERYRIGSACAGVICALALVAIAASFFIFTEATPFPGINALLVCGATAAIIQFGNGAKLIGIVLANPVSAFLGRISYSLYLVHWPLVVFYRYAVFRDITPIEKAGLLAATIGLGWLLYEFVERRFRYLDYSVPNSMAFALASIGATLVFAASSWAGAGWPWRSASYFATGFVDAQMARRFSEVKRLCQERGWNTCWNVVSTDKKRVLIVGDSHAADGLNIVMPALRDDYVILNALSGCPPTRVPSVLAKGKALDGKCLATNHARFDPAYLAKFDTIIVSVLWNWYEPDDLREFLDVVKSANPAAKVIVFGNYVVLNEPCSDTMERIGARDCFRDEFVKSRFLYEDDLRKLAAEYGFLFVSKKDHLCSKDGCLLYADDAKTIPMTWDKHHQSYEFAQLLGEKVKNEVRSFVHDDAPGAPMLDAGDRKPPVER